MIFSIFDAVVLKQDLPEEGLIAGSIGAIVDVLTNEKEVYLVEFCDEFGKTIAMPILLPSQIKIFSNDG